MVGRPNHVEHVVLEYMDAKSDPVLDLKVDAPALMRFARERHIDDFDMYDVVKRLKKKQLLHPLQSGRYVARQAPARSPRLWSLDPVADAVLRRLDYDYYVSWHAALWHYGLIDQQSRRISVAIPKERKKAPVRLGASRIEFIRISERKFFRAAVDVKDLEWTVKFATMSRALIDSFDRPELVGPPPVIIDALRRAWVEKELDPDQLVEDVRGLESPTLNRRIGFFMELLGIPGSDPLALRTGRGYAEPLFPGLVMREKLAVDPKWRVYVDHALITTALELK